MPKLSAKTAKNRNPEAARSAILKAALNEFANEGLDGGRTDHIARAAGVNKALLYYYYKDKEALYGAVLDHVFGSMFQKISAALDSDASPREKILAYVQGHFDFIAGAPLYPRLVMREMMRSGRTPSPHLIRIFKTFATPVYAKLMQALTDGVRCGDFHPVNPAQTIPSILGIIIFYFVSSPAYQVVTGVDPLAPEHIAARREAILDFISHALFNSVEPKIAAPRKTKSSKKVRTHERTQ